MNKQIILAITSVLFFTGCQYRYNFNPKTSNKYMANDKAKALYQNDLIDFQKSNCSIIELGELFITAKRNNVDYDDLIEKAESVAAKKGATHILFVNTMLVGDIPPNGNFLTYRISCPFNSHN